MGKYIIKKPETKQAGCHPTAVGLRTIPIFSQLSDTQLRPILSQCREIARPKGTVIIHQEEESADLYYVLGGELKVSLLHEDGREAVLAELSAGDFFGEISFIDNKARSATVTALTDVQMLFLPGKHFIGVLRENADIGISILSVMGKRLRRSNEAIETLTFLDVTGRVSKLLLEHASVHGEKNADGSVRIKGITHQKIALQVGASREAVTKTLQALEEKGLIRAKRGEIIILRR